MKKTMYMVIYEHYANAIIGSELKPGEKLPTELEIAEQFDVSRITVRKAMKMLTDNGLITRISGKGTFINEKPVSAGQDRKAYPSGGKLIGVMMSDISAAFGIKFLKGVQAEASSNGHSILLHMGYASQEDEHHGVEQLIANGVKGIIIMPVHGSSYNPTILRQAILGYPIVLADIYLNGLSVPYVGSDNRNACKKLVEYLFTLGHTNIAFISSIATTSAILERRDGFINAYADRKISMYPGNIYLDLRCTMPGNATPEIIREDIGKLKAFFGNNRKITAAVAADHNIASVVKTTLEELGMSVPEDLSLACFDEPESPFVKKYYTHIRQNEFEIGKISCRLLIQAMNGENTSRRITVETELIEGTSTRPI